ncbi:MAG: lipopolysaccharide heptosyltransferase I [Methylophilaceae bacterium]
MRILIIKTTSLGDVVHCLPIIADIKQHFPNALIDWVVEDHFVDILKLHPHINNIITVAIRRWRKAIFSSKTWHAFNTFKQQLQAQPYDVVIDAQGLFKSGLMTYLSHSQNKCGYDKTSARESWASGFYDSKFNINYQQHAVTRNRTLAALSLDFRPPNNAPDYGIQASPKLDATLNLTQPFIIALHGTSRDSKLWLTEHWVSLGQQLATHKIQLVLPWASGAEHQRAKLIASQLSNAVVLPKLSITALASVISQSLAALGVDTGLSHLAAALNKHVVAIYTDTNPALTGVMAGALACVNLGGQNQQPSPQEVMRQLSTFGLFNHA